MTAEQNKDIRDIDNFDTVTNLQALIVDDLRKLGVKIPHRRDLSSMRAPPTETQKVQHFKNYLGYVPCYYLEPFGHVPSFLVRAAAIIEQNIFVEGIFRKSGSLSRQKKVEEEIEKECDVSSANVFDITSLIKQFFRELREPLLTNLYRDSFLKCLQIWNNTTNSSDVLKSDECPVVKLCLLLPPEHLSTLRFTMNLFSKIAAASGQNKMNVRNLSLVMAPSIMHSYNKGDKITDVEEKLLPLQMSLMELLIFKEKNIGLVSNALYERAETMTACFGNVMEPDSANIKVAASGHKKKERRSGSLQGFVSTIAQSITRWHRSGNNSYSRSSITRSSPDLTKVSDASYTDKPVQLTPVILGKRKAPKEMATSGLSASKRKAGIIGQQPLLPNTPSRKLTSRMQDDSNQYDLKANLLPNTPNRNKTSPSKKTKRKPFFQVLCASKSSKKIEEVKNLGTKLKEPNIQEFGLCREPVGNGKGSRRRKRSASPFHRFMKKKKSENLVPCASPAAKETRNHQVRRSSTGSCYSPHPAAAVSVSIGFADPWVNSNPNQSKPVASVIKKHDDISMLSNECLTGNKVTLTNSVKDSLLIDNGENSDSDQSNDGFSTISGGTVIFVANVEKKSETINHCVLSENNNISTSLNKYDLKPCNHESTQLHMSHSRSVERRRTSLQSIQHKNSGNNHAKKRSYSAVNTQVLHRPAAIANLKVTGETKKILQRAQVPDKYLIQPGNMMYCSSPVIADQKNFHRTSSLQNCKAKVSQSSSLVCDQISATPKQKGLSPAISKADDYLRHFSNQKVDAADKNNHETNGNVSSQWTRYIDANGQPCLYKNVNHFDCFSAPTPTKCPRLRRVSSPLSVYKTKEKMEVTGVFDIPGNRRQTEYKQMIKACLNSPNLYKGVLMDNSGETCLRSPLTYKKRHRSLDGTSNTNVSAIRQKYVLKEFEKREQLHQKNVNCPSSKNLLEQFTENQTISLEKENSVFLSPAPILRYRKEQLPMVQINVGKGPNPQQLLQDSNKGSQSSLRNGIIKNPMCDIKNVHIKPALVPTPVKIKHHILDHKIHSPVKAIHGSLDH